MVGSLLKTWTIFADEINYVTTSLWEVSHGSFQGSSAIASLTDSPQPRLRGGNGQCRDAASDKHIASNEHSNGWSDSRSHGHACIGGHPHTSADGDTTSHGHACIGGHPHASADGDTTAHGHADSGAHQHARANGNS